jgi:transcriptional regulator with XRE-family HTH domain
MKPEELLGRRIREIRKARNLTIDQLSEAIGVNEKYLGSVERGEQNPSFKILEKIARGLSVPPSELFIYEHTENDPKSLKQRINQRLNKGSLEDLQLFLKIIKSIVE